jgi:hypothetical protein
MKACFDGIVGMRNVCGGSTAKYYLDEIGISLKTAAKTVDSKYVKGSDLVNAKIAQAWRDTLNDVVLGGFEFKKVVCEKTYGRRNHEGSTLVNGTGSVMLTRVGYQDQTSIYIGSIDVENDGQYTITVSDGFDTFTATTDTDTVNVRKAFNGKTITVTIDYLEVYSGQLGELSSECNCAGCGVYATGDQNYGMRFDVQQICDKEAYLCRYAELLGEAVMYKAGALLLKELMDTDRVNDFTIMKEGNLLVNMAYLDSSLNMFQYEESKPVTDGKYQQVMARLNREIVAPKKSCCVVCKGGSYSISLP